MKRETPNMTSVTHTSGLTENELRTYLDRLPSVTDLGAPAGPRSTPSSRLSRIA